MALTEVASAGGGTIATTSPTNDPRDLSAYDDHALYTAYAELVRRVIYRLMGQRELDDLVQDTFVKALSSRASFRQDSSVKTWLTRIAVNTAIDAGRKATVRKNTEPVEDVDTIAGRSRDPALALAIQQAVASLPEEWRAAFVLVVMEGFTAAEAAEALGDKPGTVRSRVHRAREQVRERLRPAQRADREAMQSREQP